MVMDISVLLDFIETHCEEACAAVDLRNEFVKDGRGRGRPLRLVFDAEPCLVFLYGGKSGDWVSGGQWNNTVQFLQSLFETCSRCNIEATVFFNGVSVRERYGQWCESQLSCSRRIQDIVRLIRTKAFHPPKALWVAPCGLTSMIRLALNNIGVPTVSSHRDHQLEIISFARENGFDGIVSWDADLTMFHAPPRYFSAQKLFLGYNGTFSTVEIDVDGFARIIDLHPSRFCILATLLGNHIMPVTQLQEFYSRICHLSSSIHVVQYPAVEKIRAVIHFLRKLPSVDDLNEVARAVFGPGYATTQAAENFKQSVEYYRKGREAGKLSSNSLSRFSIDSHDSYSSPRKSNSGTSLKLDQSRLPGDGVDKDMRLSSAQIGFINSITSAKMEPHLPSPHCSDPPSQTLLLGGWDEEVVSIPTAEYKVQGSNPKVPVQSRGLVDYTTLFGAGGYSTSDPGCNASTSSANMHPLSSPIPKWWKVAPEVLKTAQERHRKAVMMTWVYQILIHGEIFLPPLLEDDKDTSLAKAIDLFRPLRQRVYSILLERESEKISDSDAVVREWSIMHASSTPLPTFNVVEVPAAAASSSSTMQSLCNMWFGVSQDDVALRMQSFLDCFGCLSIQHLLLNQTNIRPHFLILCCVLRYLVIQKSVLIADENVIQGFLSTAVSNRLHDPKAIRELNIPVMSMHSIQLATIFMHGFENALFANEAFGSPLPVDLFCPSQYFDGKLFHYKMAKIGQKSSLAELCENSLEQQMYLQRMQTAIISSLPKDCAYSSPFLWKTGPGTGNGLGPPSRDQGLLSRDQGLLPRDQGLLPRDQGLLPRVHSLMSRDLGLPPRDQGPYGHFPGRRGNSSNPNSSNFNSSRDLVFQPAGAIGIPSLLADEKHCMAVISAPSSRAMRGDARTRHTRGRVRNAGSKKRGKVSSNVEPVQREARSSYGHQSITTTSSRRGAIGQRSELVVASISSVQSFGRGRGCTVEMDIPNCSETPSIVQSKTPSIAQSIETSVKTPSIAQSIQASAKNSETPSITQSIEASVKSWIGRGRSLPSRTTETKVGAQHHQQHQQQQQVVTVSTMLPLEDATRSPVSQLKNDLQQSVDLTQFCNAVDLTQFSNAVDLTQFSSAVDLTQFPNAVDLTQFSNAVDLTQFSNADAVDTDENRNETGGKEEEQRDRVIVTGPERASDDIFLSMPSLVKKSNAAGAGERWSSIMEAEEELSLSKLTVEEEEEEEVEEDKTEEEEKSELVMASNEALHRLDQIPEEEHSILLNETFSDAVDSQEPIEY